MLSSGSASSLNNIETAGSHSINEEDLHTPHHHPRPETPRTSGSSLLSKKSPPSVASSPSTPTPSRAISGGRFKAGMMRMFGKNPTVSITSDDGIEHPVINRKKRRAGLKRLVFLPRRGSRSAVFAAITEDDPSYMSDPEALATGLLEESEDEGDSGEIDLSPEELQKKTELEQKLKEAKEMILLLEDNAEAQSTDETAATNKAWQKLIAASKLNKKNTSLDYWKKKRDQYADQLKSNDFSQHRRRLRKAKQHFNFAIQGLKKLPHRKRWRSKPPSEGENGINKIDFVEDNHDHDSDEDDDALRSDLDGLTVSLQECKSEYEALQSVVKHQQTEIEDLKGQLEIMSESLVNEKGRTEHLEASLMEVMELKKHEIENLQMQLTHVETQSLDRNQWFEEQLQEYSSKIDNMEVSMHKQRTFEEINKTDAPRWTRRLVFNILSCLLVLFTTILGVTGYMQNKPHGLLLVAVVLIALVSYFVHRNLISGSLD